VTIQPNLVRRLKSHFISLPCGVDLILALNGYIWVSKHVKETEQEGEDGFDAEAVYSNQNDVRPVSYKPLHSSFPLFASQDIDVATRAAITRVCNIIQVFSSHSVPVSDALLIEAYEWLVEQESDGKDLLLSDDFAQALVATVISRSSF
jgi:exosome complex component RRP4